MGGALPPALLCAALGFALSFAPRRSLPVCLIAACAVAGLVSFIPFPGALEDAIFLGCWASIVVSALLVYLPGRAGPRTALALAVNAGVWTGAVVSCAGAPPDLAKALPWVLICLPGAWIVSRKRQVVLQVAASWLVAVAVLAAALPATTPTPGYVADHME